MSVDENEVTLELDATISFTADVSYGDSWDHKSAELERTTTVPVEVTIRYERSNLLNYEVTSATVNNGESIHVYVDEDAETNWK